MRRDIRLWAIEKSQNEVEELVPHKGAETEKEFENLLSRNPDLLMPGLKLVARQAPAGIGALDLLGIDDNGRMIVFELKKEQLARDSIAQIIDYSSFIETLDEDEIADYIVKHSGKNEIDKIEDFQTWYEERHGSSEGELRPVRMILAAFDVDPTAQRMVEFLNERGVAISIQTYSRYSRGEETLLVGHHDRAIETRTGKQKTEESYDEKIGKLNDRAIELGIGDYWASVVGSLNSAHSPTPRNNRPPRKSGITFYQRSIKLSDGGTSYYGSHSVLMEDGGEDGGKVKITFFPIAVHLCHKLFDKTSVSFEKEPPPNVPTTEDVREQWFCVLNRNDWETHEAELGKLAKQVYTAWERHRAGGPVP